MGKFKKEKNRRAREGDSSGGSLQNVKVKGENFYRDAAKVKKVNMYKDGKPVRNAKGEIVKAAAFQSKEIPKARVEPNRRWFNSTRVIAQDALAEFRERIGTKINDPYQILLRRNKLPLSLLQEPTTVCPLRSEELTVATKSSSCRHRTIQQHIRPQGNKKTTETHGSSFIIRSN